MGLRPDLQEVLDAFDAADRAAEATASPLSDTQFHWQPNEGRAWSVAQCLEHLATANELYLAGLTGAVDQARVNGWTAGRPIASTFFGRRFVASQEPPVKMRMKAPGAIRPKSTASRDEIMRAYFAAHEKLRAVVRSAADIDVNRATFQNPFIKVFRVRVGTGLRILNAHDRRHLWQAAQVVKADGFPR